MEVNGVCRCCLNEGLHKDLKAPYMFLDRKEVYSDMLLDCFNIVLLPSDTLSNAICNACVKSLRESYNFKHQVLRCQTQLLLKSSIQVDSDDVKEVQVKLEPKRDSDDDSDDYFLADAVREVTMDQIKVEDRPVEKTLRKKKLQIVKAKDSNWKTTRVKSLVSRLASSINDMPPKAKKRDSKKITISIQKDVPKLTWQGSLGRERHKHMDNLQTILKYTNATPFKDKSLLGFICGYCDTAFPDPANLRAHTDRDHKLDRLNLKVKGDMTDYNVKLDITDLTCNICEEKFHTLPEIRLHLLNVHKKTIHTGIKDLLIQFKLNKGDTYNCSLCTSTYETFKMLKQHMNVHYKNFECNLCDSAFTTKRSLNAHKTTHQEGSFKCEHCDKVFPSPSKMHYHVKMRHLGARNISNCPYCNESFRSYYQRNQHLIKVHNAECQYKCNVCNRGFILKSLLMYHIKKNHLMERDAQCTECGYRFFSKKALKAHMVKHTGERKYSCEVCHKNYARKYTLREHMRIHNNDRRFKCDVCAMTFVQKCSLKSHLLSNHGISLAACEITTS